MQKKIDALIPRAFKGFVTAARKKLQLKDAPLAVSLLFIALTGLGNQLVYLACVGALFAWMLYVAETRREKIMWALCLALLLFFPALGHSTGLIALLLICHGKRNEGASLLGSQLLCLVSPSLPMGSIWISPLCSGIIYVLIYAGLALWRRREIISGATICLYALCLLWQSNQTWPLDAVPSESIGAAIGKITHETPSEKGQLVYLNHEYTPVNPAGSLYLDHEARTDYDDGDFFQPRPWSHNTLIAGETIRLAVAMDGALISNIGARCTDVYGHILYAMADGLTVCPLALNINHKLILADSDYVSNALAPYQPHLLRRLTGTDYGWRVYWGILSLMLIGSILIKRAWLPLLNMGILLTLMLRTVEGDVRYIGTPCLWPHTTQAGGIVRAMQENGQNVIFGNKNTTILAIAEGRYATAREEEKLIILEPDASVYIQGIKYTAGNIPQGDAEGIRDARTIDKEGIIIACGRVIVDGVELIATGSPARIMEKEEVE